MANVFAYRYPITGSTPPTVQQNQGHSRVSGIVTTDGATASLVITHNLGISVADLAADLPDVTFEPKDAAFNAQNVFVANRDANTVTLTTDGDGVTVFGVRIERPTTAVR